MARKKKETQIVSNTSLAELPVIDVDFPEQVRAGRAPKPSVYEPQLIESMDAQKSQGIVYDGTEDQYNDIRRELERGARHLGFGLRGPVASMLEDGNSVVVFQAVPKRVYNRKPSDEVSVSE